MKKISLIAVVSHFALLRSELCDIINSETEYSAESKSFEFVKSCLEKGNPDNILCVLDLDSFNVSQKAEFSKFVASGYGNGMVVLFGSMDISSMLRSPYKESTNYFVPKPSGHLASNERFLRNFDIALTRAAGIIDGPAAKAKLAPGVMGTKPKTLPPAKAPMTARAPSPAQASPKAQPAKEPKAEGSTIRGRMLHSQIGESAFVVTPEQLHVKIRKKCKLSAGGRISDPNIIVAIASSTGGPKALQDFVPMLPANLAAPVILTQHMPAGFTKSMAERLDEISKIRVKEAEEGELLQNGTVYIAPGGKHLVVKQSREGHIAAFSDEPPVGGLKPCADIMYRSLQTSAYTSVLCVVLTGMGADGTRGIVRLGERKEIYVLSQDEHTCVVYGMPKSIAEAGYSDEVLPLLSIAPSIQQKVGVK